MLRPIGKVTVPVPTTIVQVISVLGVRDAQREDSVHGVMIQALPGNTGKVFIGTSALVAATHVGVIAILGVPTTNILPSFSAALTIAPNAIALKDLWIDADASDDGVIVTVLVT